MAEISASMVKELREKTGAGMMDCKNALKEVNGDLEKAIDWLRQKGMAKAAKKAGRATSEGLVVLAKANDEKTMALASLLCETDFVTRSDQFQALAKKTAQTVLDKQPKTKEELQGILGTDLQELIASIGENMQFGDFACHSAKANGIIGNYVHANNKIGVLIDLECENAANCQNPEVLELAKNLAMQVAATAPLSLSAEDLDKALIEREREVYKQKAKEEGKADKADRIADGAVKKYQKEVCLLEQLYIKDDKKTITDLVKEVSKNLGDKIKVVKFSRVPKVI